MLIASRFLAISRKHGVQSGIKHVNIAGSTARLSSAQTKASAAAKAAGIGLAAGGLGSLVGMGGAFIALPFLTGAIGLSQHKAHGTSMAAVLATGLAGCISYSSGSAVDWVAGGVVAATGAVSAVLGARLAGRLSEHKLKRLLALFMMAIAPTVPIKQHYLKLTNTDEATASTSIVKKVNETKTLVGDSAADGKTGQEGNKLTVAYVTKLGTIGVCTGLLAGLFGVGGGAVTVPALSLFMDMNYHQAVGTSLAAMVPTAFTGAITYFRAGHLVIQTAWPLAVGTAAGAYIGGKYGLSIQAEYLTWLFAVMMMGLGMRTWRGANKLKAAAGSAAAVAAGKR